MTQIGHTQNLQRLQIFCRSAVKSLQIKSPIFYYETGDIL